MLKLVELVTWCGLVPDLVAVERLALGMTTDVIQIADKRPDSIGARIAQDAVATGLATAVLDCLTGTAQKDR